MDFLSLGLIDDKKQAGTETGANGEPREGAASIAVSPETHTDDTLLDDGKDEPTSSLPRQIEELREKLSAKNKGSVPRPAPLAASVNALSVAERQGVPTFATFKFGYLPARGLLYSSIGHELALFGLFMLFTYGMPLFRPQKLIVRPNEQDHLVYLPEVGGGTQGQTSPGAGKSLPQQASAAPAHASKGFAYPSPQSMLSDPVNPTNTFQTIQRPLLVHPELIRKLVPLPNIVRMAETRLPSDLIAPKAAVPQLHEVPKAIHVKQDSSIHRNAKFNVPVTEAPTLLTKSELPKLPAAELPLPQAPVVEQQPKQETEKTEVEKPSPKPIKVTTEKRAEKPEKQAAPPSAAQVARMEMHGKDKEPLVSLSPMPLPPGTDAKIPAGEALGKFAMAPGGTLNPNSINPGKPNGTPSTSPGTGQENSKAANAATEVASNATAGSGHSAAVGGGSGNAAASSGEGSTGTGGGRGNTSGAGQGGDGNGKGRGSAGTGAGKTSGRGSGTGTGAGSGSGTGSFPGITIQGGEDNANANPPAFTLEPQTGYQMTVVSTAKSGGGLEDFGVFDNERIFTVYIPMKRTPEEADPTWTLQYAMMTDDSSDANTVVMAPSPVMREWPQVPAELEKKYGQRQVVIFAVVDKEGKVSRVAVKQTPDTRVSDPIARAFAKWVFRPAQANSQPVAVKVLIGIPLS